MRVNKKKMFIKGTGAGGGFCGDADADAFIDATGITDTDQKNAICTLVSDLKNNSLYAKMFAVYPIIGGTADTHKYNLIDPQDTDAAFRITWIGSVIHLATGYDTNSATGKGDSQFTPSTDGMTSTNGGMTAAVYLTNSAQYMMGIKFGGQEISLLSRNTLAGGRAYSSSFCGANPGDGLSGKGVVSVCRIGTSLESYKNGVTMNTITGGGTPPAQNISLGNANNVGGDDAILCFHAIHEGLDDTETANLHTIIDTFSASLSRKSW